MHHLSSFCMESAKDIVHHYGGGGWVQSLNTLVLFNLGQCHSPAPLCCVITRHRLLLGSRALLSPPWIGPCGSSLGIYAWLGLAHAPRLLHDYHLSSLAHWHQIPYNKCDSSQACVVYHPFNKNNTCRPLCPPPLQVPLAVAGAPVLAHPPPHPGVLGPHSGLLVALPLPVYGFTTLT